MTHKAPFTQKALKMPRLDELANVALRVPSILVLDLLYKCDIEGLTDHLKAKNEDMLFKYKYVIWNMYYLGKDVFTPLSFDSVTSVLSVRWFRQMFHIELSPDMCVSPLFGH